LDSKVNPERGLEYTGIDFADERDERIGIFDANPTMIVVLPHTFRYWPIGASTYNT